MGEFATLDYAEGGGVSVSFTTPNGVAIAGTIGIGFGDACAQSLQLVILSGVMGSEGFSLSSSAPS